VQELPPSRPGTFRQVVRPALEVRLAHQPQYPLAFDVLGIAVPDEDLDPEFVEDESTQLGGAGFGRAGCGSRRGLLAPAAPKSGCCKPSPGWEKVAQVFVAETGADVSRDTAVAHLAAWTGLVPAMNESAGKQSPAGKRHGNKC